MSESPKDTDWDKLYDDGNSVGEESSYAVIQRLSAEVKQLEDALGIQELVLAKATHRESHLMEELQRLRLELNKGGHRFGVGRYTLTWSFSTNHKQTV